MQTPCSELREKREKAGLTIQEVANALNISKQIVSAWERGLKPIPQTRQNELAQIFKSPDEYKRYKITLTKAQWEMVKAVLAESEVKK